MQSDVKFVINNKQLTTYLSLKRDIFPQANHVVLVPLPQAAVTCNTVKQLYCMLNLPRVSIENMTPSSMPFQSEPIR